MIEAGLLREPPRRDTRIPDRGQQPLRRVQQRLPAVRAAVFVFQGMAISKFCSESWLADFPE